MSAINHALIGTSLGESGPTVPGNFYAQNTTESITLYWNDSDNETDYQLERSSDNITFSQIATPGQNQTSFIDFIGIFPNTTYYYRIRARGNGNLVSPYSNTVTITTPAFQSSVFVGSNSYITFGGGSFFYSNLGAANPNLPKIMISAADNSYQRVYTQLSGTEPNRLYRVRFEGNNSTGGTVGSPTMVWEAVFYELQSYRIDLHIGANSRSPFGVSGVYSADSLIAAFPTSNLVNVAYQIETFIETIVTPITLNLNGPVGMDLIHQGSVDDTYLRLQIPWYVSFLNIPY